MGKNRQVHKKISYVEQKVKSPVTGTQIEPDIKIFYL